MSKFPLTSVIDNVHMLMCMNNKFPLTSFALTSLICCCEQINKFSLTSFHCSQQNNYTAMTKKQTTGRHYSESSQEQDHSAPPIDLFGLYILFSQYRSCDNTQEAWSFVLFIKKSACRHIHACMPSF